MFGTQSSIIAVYVDRNRLQFFGGGLPSILALDIPPAIAKDLEIINRDALYTLVNQWLKQNNLGGAQLFFVLSATTYFERTIITTGESEQETEILAFYDSIPFEELATRVFSVGTKKLAVGTNKEFLDAIAHAFMLQGLHIASVIPVAVLGTMAAKRWLDAEMGAYILKHVDTLRGQALIDLTEPGQLVNGPSPAAPTSKNNPRLMIMVGLLGVLLLVLIFLAFMRH